MPTNNLSFWEDKRGKIVTKNGGWRIGDAIYTYGYSLIDDLVGKKSYFEILILSIKGKLPNPKLAKWLEYIYSCMSFPDSRIWCNQIGSLGGNIKASPIASITAGLLASDSRMYGPGTMTSAYNFIQPALDKHNNGLSIKEIVDQYARRPGTKPNIPGYGRPLATGDERVLRMKTLTLELSYNWGPYMALALEIEKYLEVHIEENMNLATFIVAFLLDQDWNLEEIKQITSLLVTAGVMACYSETFKEPAESFLPLRCDDILYIGSEYRPIPNN